MIGGMSWEASIEHYRIINEVTRERLVGLSALHWESAWSITAQKRERKPKKCSGWPGTFRSFSCISCRSWFIMIKLIC